MEINLTTAENVIEECHSWPSVEVLKLKRFIVVTLKLRIKLQISERSINLADELMKAIRVETEYLEGDLSIFLILTEQICVNLDLLELKRSLFWTNALRLVDW